MITLAVLTIPLLQALHTSESVGKERPARQKDFLRSQCQVLRVRRRWLDDSVLDATSLDECAQYRFEDVVEVLVASRL